MQKSPATSCGFTLVELAVVITVIGLLLGASSTLVKPYVDSYRYSSTRQKMEHIADALAKYARINYDLPCPADPDPSVEPFGAPRGSTSDGDALHVACSSSATYGMSGIVPFRALGLDESQVKDSYGNYITYTLPAIWNRYKNISLDSDMNHIEEIHKDCRSGLWLDTVIDGGLFGYTANDILPEPAVRSKNYRKARFCCPVISNDGLNIFRDNDLDFDRRLFINRYDNDLAVAQDSASANRIWDAHSGDSAAEITASSETVAFVLVSHGRNGDGALLRSGDRRPVSTAVATTHETPNRTLTHGNFVMRAPSYEQDAGYFDDIVVWRSNYAIISSGGNDSCARP